METAPLNTAMKDSLEARGISEEQLRTYRKALIEGYPFVKLAANCKIGAEIHRTDGEGRKRYIRAYQNRKGLKVMKFVPASGAASRMFKDLFAALENNTANEASKTFFENFDRFPFSQALIDVVGLPKQIPLNDSVTRLDVLRALLLKNGLNYGNLPKGMIKFHRYPDGHSRTAFEEHFHEAVRYAADEGHAHLHFTVPETNREETEVHLSELKTRLSSALRTEFHVDTSVQKPSTDTPAIYEGDYSWVTREDGSLLFRPAGHGALLDNLNDLDADIVFIKNIDNVVPDAQKQPTKIYKEVLGGILLEVSEQVFSFLRALDRGDLERKACAEFCQKWFAYDVSNKNDEEIRALLNRPVRVCGMVKNEGEPGGGPFLVREPDGSASLQIVEKAQVDTDDAEQKAILESAGHFNPVDIAVGMKNYKGEPFDLLKYRNPGTGMTVAKTHRGKSIRALELPGLWNGSMHDWNTVFAEVPIETFNPVKTVFDLLRPAHQGT